MNRKNSMKLFKYLVLLLPVLLMVTELDAQTRVTERGTSVFRKVGIHRGNQVRTVFSNWGVIAQPGTQGPAGAWKYDANEYVGDVSPLVAVQLPVQDYNNDGVIDKADTIVSVIITPVERPGGGDFAPGGKFWGFEPVPGFANANLNETGKGIAMSHQPETWPDMWPDQPTWSYSGKKIIQDGVDITPKVDWNGYFGRAQISADQESYFWMDDFNDEKMFERHGFLPDSQDPTRKGHALQVSVRGLQWANFLAQDVVFWLYNIKNDGTSTYDKTAFGTLVGTYVGGEGDEWNDDASFFDVREAITYTWDFERSIRASANPRWRPNPSVVGYIAYAFLESPGNGYDGIDNDGDNRVAGGNAPFFVEQDYQNRTLQPGQTLMLIDKTTFNRTPYVVPNDSFSVVSMGVTFKLKPGVTILNEGSIDVQGNLNPNGIDGIDNDLDGLIDENFLIHYKQYRKSPAGTVLIDTLNPVQYKNYITSAGLFDKMIDERRDDGIDNDGDWNPQFDDLGADGKPNTGDFGEGDGIPTAGEPNFDATDVDESDQLGLTSFQYFVPANDITMNNEDDMWRRLTPGYFDVPNSIVNNVAIKGEDGDFMYGSGYFPLLPGRTERFSLALAYGDDYQGVIKTKKVAQIIYNANYNFPKPPTKPTMTAVAGNKQVTLYWDNEAEKSVDPTTKINDFEGYKVYRGTDPDFTDALQISDGSGSKVFLKPLAQFDLVNGVKGYFLAPRDLYDITSGAPYWLGSDNGVQNSFVDQDVINGKTYYYAVVAYDRGEQSTTIFQSGIFPSENTRFIAQNVDGTIATDINTAVIVPNAPVLGYVPPSSGEKLTRVTGNSSAGIYYEAVDPRKIAADTYEVSFNDTTVKGVKIADSYNLVNKTTGDSLIIANRSMTASNGQIFEGMRLSFDNRYQNYDSIKVDNANSGWNSADLKGISFVVANQVSTIIGVRNPRDYVLVFSDSATGSSSTLSALPSNPPIKKTNFEIYEVKNAGQFDKIKYAYADTPPTLPSITNNDRLFLANPAGDTLTWIVTFRVDSTVMRTPKAGDTLYIRMFKPYTSNDKFAFTPEPAKYDANNATKKLGDIKVVPNPYVVTNKFERPLPPQIRGRGERVINFINVPPRSKIHIYTSAGQHIRSLESDGDIFDGSVSWDVRTKEGLDVAFGVYFYVIEIEGTSDTKTGKIAIIK